MATWNKSRESFVTIGSEEYYDFKCTRCEGKRRATEAKHYCPECHEYYCSNCVELHSEFAYLKSHRVYDEKAKQNWGKAGSQGPVGLQCRHHADQHVSMFCGRHDALCCTVCVSQDHRNCEGVEYIPLAASGIFNKPSISNLEKDIQSVLSRLEDLVKNGEDKKSSLQESRLACRQALNNFRRKVDTIMDRLDEKAVDDMDKICKASENDIEFSKNVCLETTQKLKQLQETLTDIEGLNESQMFIRLKTAQGQLAESQDAVATIAAASIKDRFTLVMDFHLENFLENIQSLGTFITSLAVDNPATQNDQKAQTAVPGHLYHLSTKEEISIKFGSENRDCCIESMCQVESGDMVLADSINSCLKLLDQTYTVVDSCPLISYPYAVCTVGQNLVAAALHNNSLQFVSTQNGKLRETKKMQLGHQCCSIAASDTKLYISEYMGNRVHIYSSAFCTLLGTIYKDRSRNRIIRDVTHLCASSDGSKLYVADSDRRILVFNRNEQIVGSITSKDVDDVGGICLDHLGHLFIGCKSSSKILQVINNVPTVIASLQEGVLNTSALCFDKFQSKLLVFSGNRNSYITVFKLV